jgi:serine phosphatase RsbU (regulator of sigma subunit)
MFEVLFLSFALADRISTYRKEKEIAQKQFIASVQENERIILEQNQILEHKVKERTIQLASTNEELNTSNEELQTTLETVQEQSRIIAKKNKDITSSITYAKRIQEAMLPSFSLIKKHIPEVFVLFKPRDVVSGDFYYFDNQEHINIIAVVDCTGHGVPGAFMSMIGNDILNTIIHDKEILQPNKILYWLDILIRKALKQNENENRDGMDMTICTINTENKEIQYSGAMNPLYYWQENTATLQEIKATKKPIGGKILNNDEFILHNISYQSVENTVLYLCTDGFQDQFGGKDNKKFMTKRFKELLLSIAHLPILEQGKILDATITEWIGHRDQTDDITVMGIKI